ncbi:MAG: FAD-binding protein [Saprospiraceae bacterium]|nr:FAD-binding protein [Saprospiraceae bacterium]
MSQEIEVEIKVSPDKIEDRDYIEARCLEKAGISGKTKASVHLLKRSIDARYKDPLYIIRARVTIGGNSGDEDIPIITHYLPSGDKPKVIIIGAGPAGYFAALQCLELGLCPIVLDRGKDVQARRRDLKAIQQDGIVNPHSNYCFGEGGAGTYSDGKLYTRSHKRGDIEKVLQILHAHGAHEDILIDAHPHIGSNKLPNIVANIRKTIETYGGQVHFDSYVTAMDIKEGRLNAVHTEDGRSFEGKAFILATGHSARDIYYLLDRHGVKLEAKPFALGVRIEHPQRFIDKIQYRQDPRDVNLPAASYKVVSQVDDTGVFSFCMCPGGLVVPAATAPGEIVVNGMSLSRRDSPFANSGFVTSIELPELHKHGYKGIFACLDFQAEVEQKMFSLGDGSQKAPAQRVDDFVKGKTSASLFETSYIPSLFSAPLHEQLPDFIAHRLREAVKNIDKKMRGFLSHEANVIATESRTSAPVKIPRDTQSFMHPQLQAMFPCGEGAGYAGGILSAAMDGQNVAMAVARFVVAS